MFNLTQIQENEIEKLSEIFSQVFTETDPKKPWDVNHAREYLLYWIKKQRDMFFVAHNELGEAIGAMVVNIKPWRTGIRCTDGVVFVDKKYQKQGIAKLLFKKVIGEAMLQYNATSFEAVTFSEKQFPLTWYESIGILPDKYTVFIKGDCTTILDHLSE